MKVDTWRYSGRISKTATIHSNDPRARSRTIALEAYVRPLIRLKPTAVNLEGKAGEVVKGTVEIRTEKDSPLRLGPVHFDLQEKVTYTLEEVEQGRLYRVHFSSVPGLSGYSHGRLTLKTNYPERPEITIRVRCRFGP